MYFQEQVSFVSHLSSMLHYKTEVKDLANRGNCLFNIKLLKHILYHNCRNILRVVLLSQYCWVACLHLMARADQNTRWQLDMP